MRKIILLLTALVALGGLAACGDTAAKNGYVDKVNKLQQAAVTDINADMTAASSSDPATAAAAMTKLADRTDKLASDVDALDPPKDFQTGDAHLVKSLRDIAATSRKAATALKAGDSAGALKLISDLNTAQGEFSSAVDEINAAR